MATSARTPLDSYCDWHSPESPPVWASSFPASEQEDFSKDDLTVGVGGSSMPIAVAALGLLLLASCVIFVAI